MRIRTARLQGFRNLADMELEFSPGANVFVGPNGQGKTNLLEALHYPVLGQSHRGARRDELIAFGRTTARVEVVAAEERPERSVVFAYGLERGGAPRVRVDGRMIPRRLDLVGRLAAVYFDPETVRLVREGPEQRRRFIDRGLALTDPPYLAALTAYHRALRQKARILRDTRRDRRRGADIRAEIGAWNRELASHAVGVVTGRDAYARMLGPAAMAVHHDLTGDGQDLEIDYRPNLESVRSGFRASGADGGEESARNSDLERDIRAEFDYIWSDEVRCGRPLRGPQRDEFGVHLAGRPLRTFGSQGETRTAAVALILGQSEVVWRRRGMRPVLFLDDIFSELDRDRARRLQDIAAADHQIFVATARSDDVAGWRPREHRLWRVAAGLLRISEGEGAA